MHTEAQCSFLSSLPDQFRVAEDLQVQLSTGSTAKDLSEVVKTMIEEEGELSPEDEALLKTRKL